MTENEPLTLPRFSVALDLLRLAKPNIALLAALTAAAGWLLGSGNITIGLIFPFVGTFLLAGGSATLNNLQDRRLDACMARTQNRPLPRGRIAPSAAWISTLTLVFAGLALLGLSEHRPVTAAILGLAALALYNGAYTRLKRRTPYATVPGALVGMLPPLIGWAASGASFTVPQIWLVAGFYFLWQIPHFWLLLILNDADYVRAGLPVMTERLAGPAMARVTATWMLACALAGMICAASLHLGLAYSLPMLAAPVLLIECARRMLHAAPDARAFRLAFNAVNLYALTATLLFGLGGLADPTFF